MLMNLINQVNCRVVDADEMNVFKTLFNNLTFWFVLIAEVLLQNCFVWGASAGTVVATLVGTQPLTLGQSITCWVLGLLSLAVHPASKKVPLKYFAKVTEKLDLEAEPAESVAHRTLFKMQNSIRERRDSVLNFGIDDSQAALLRKAADQHAINEASEEDGSDNSSDGEKDV